MDVIINDQCRSIPNGVELLISQGQAASNLLSLLGYDPLNPPTADLLRVVNKLNGNWVVLSLIHWQASHNDAMIIASGHDLKLTEEDAASFFKLLRDYFAEEGISLYYHDAETWLMEVTDKPPLNAKPVYKIMNQSLMSELVQLDSTMYWQKFFTECQMFFASHPNNTLLNGIWAWGGAKLTDNKTNSICVEEQLLAWAQICSSQVTLYNPSVRLKDYQIILLNNMNTLSAEHKEELNKITANWYWNNMAYARKNNYWFTRIWRTLTHAH